MAFAIALASGCGCAPQPRHDVSALMSYVPTDYGVCGTLKTEIGVLVPKHCVDACESLDSMRDICVIDDPERRVAATRRPKRGETLRVVSPLGEEGAATVVSVSLRWRAAWLDWPCLRGDSGGVAWGEDGSAVCMMTGCDTRTHMTYCVELVP